MFAGSGQLHNDNKWVSQKVHRKYNNIQRASSRRERLPELSKTGGCRGSRSKKAALKQMQIDFEDFTSAGLVSSNKYGIQSIYDAYYHAAPDDEIAETHMHRHRDTPTKIDGIQIQIEMYEYKQEQTEIDLVELAFQQEQAAIAEQARRNRHSHRRARRHHDQWNWSQYAPRDQQQETDEFEMAIAASLAEAFGDNDNGGGGGAADDINGDISQAELDAMFGVQEEDDEEEKFVPKDTRVYVTKPVLTAASKVVVFGNFCRSRLPQNVTLHHSVDAAPQVSAIASQAWKSYVNNCLHNNFRFLQSSNHNHMVWPDESEWSIACAVNGKTEIVLDNVLDLCIPHLYQVYGVIFALLGYSSLRVNQTTAKLCLTGPKQKSGKPGGIDWRDAEERPGYGDYSFDRIKSYIPSHIYYKTNERKQFCKIGAYSKSDWKALTFYTQTRKRRQRSKANKNYIAT